MVPKLISRARTMYPDDHGIATGMAWVVVFVFIGKIAGAAKEMAVAWRYGVAEEVDAYIFIFNLVTWPIAIWFSVLTVVLVPLVARIRQGAPLEICHFRSELLGLTLLVGLVLLIFGWFGLPLLLASSWIGLPESTLAFAIEMAPVLVPLAPLGVLVSLFSVWMLSLPGRHTNTLLESVPALAILVALLGFPNRGAEPLLWGTLAGFVFHLVSLAVPLVWKGEIEAPRFTRRSLQWVPFWQGFGIMLAGQALMSSVTIIDQFFAAHLGTGAIATISYANRILALMLGLGAMAIGRASLPIFSKVHAQGGEQVRRLAMHWAFLLFVLGIVAMILGWWLAPWVVKLLFERGTFTSENTVIVADVLRFGLTQLPFYFAGIVLVSLLASQGRYPAIAAVAAVNLIIKIVGNYSLVTWLSVNGIVLASAFMYAASTVLCWILVRFSFNRAR